MSKMPKSSTSKYLNFLNIVEKRLTSHNQILTKKKSMILEILFKSTKHLDVVDIIKLSKRDKHKNISLNITTVYRALSNFESLGIVESIVIEDKKRYELSYLKKPHYHLYCQGCHNISEFVSFDIHNSFLKELYDKEFQATYFNVIVNGLCKKCNKINLCKEDC